MTNPVQHHSTTNKVVQKPPPTIETPKTAPGSTILGTTATEKALKQNNLYTTMRGIRTATNGSGNGHQGGTPPNTNTNTTHTAASSQAPRTSQGRGPSQPGPQTAKRTSGPSGHTSGTGQVQFLEKLSIAIFKGDPVDAYVYRHVGLYIRTFRNDALIKHNFIHVTGVAGSFLREESLGRNPLQSASRCGHVIVANIHPTSETDSRLRDTIYATPPVNTDRSWNCQHWVGDALQRCVNARLITSKQLEVATENMIDILLDAPDTAD